MNDFVCLFYLLPIYLIFIIIYKYTTRYLDFLIIIEKNDLYVAECFLKILGKGNIKLIKKYNNFYMIENKNIGVFFLENSNIDIEEYIKNNKPKRLIMIVDNGYSKNEEDGIEFLTINKNNYGFLNNWMGINHKLRNINYINFDESIKIEKIIINNLEKYNNYISLITYQ